MTTRTITWNATSGRWELNHASYSQVYDRLDTALLNAPAGTVVDPASVLAFLRHLGTVLKDRMPIIEGRDGKPQFTWLALLGVSEMWVADGFNLDNERITDMVGSDLHFATGSEYHGEVLAGPDPRAIRVAQGYEPAGPIGPATKETK